MISVKTESPLADSMVRRRYEVSVVDLLGNTHTEVLGMFNHSVENDGSQVETDFITSKKTQEIETYKSDIRRAVNPFIKNSRWNSRVVLLKAVLDDALSLPATDAMVYNGLPYLALVSDAELMTLYSKTQAWVDNVRMKTNDLLSAKVIMDNYEAVL